jgi:hypothetical protein
MEDFFIGCFMIAGVALAIWKLMEIIVWCCYHIKVM